ncbi:MULTISPECIES: hypothetical protein [unclassified Dehalobacter]|uniref:hypothetical protein n=1 Tax=unclassified Dehalobacter TaxID=2635733 RepID=UPI00037E38B1|nr:MULTISPECIES: hypothetical protein [unclassified Dehalobacter]MDJ0306020.1 hypothetical protein [Dehalobacter sp.]OCZ49475.1 hypothetical protein A7D23_03190 [Dehalobacter sp. TeCB1]
MSDDYQNGKKILDKISLANFLCHLQIIQDELRNNQTETGYAAESGLYARFATIKQAVNTTIICIGVLSGLFLGGATIKILHKSKVDNQTSPKDQVGRKKIVIVRNLKISVTAVGALFFFGSSFKFFCKKKGCCPKHWPDCKKILKLLESPTFGLAEIKTEIFSIEKAVNHPFFGLQEIKSEVQVIEFTVENIENKLDSPTFGLAEIKTEVFSIGTLVEGIFTSMMGATFGLQEIKSEVAAIEGAVFSPTFGLAEIKTEIFQIQNAVLSPTFGLLEIKSEVAAIEASLGAANAQTSGPFKLSNASVGNILDVKVMNNSASTIGPINVSVFNVDVCPKTLLSPTFKSTVTLPPYCTTSIFFNQKLPNTQIEIEVSGATPGKVFIWSRTTPTVVSDQIVDPLFSSNYLPLQQPLDP